MEKIRADLERELETHAKAMRTLLAEAEKIILASHGAVAQAGQPAQAAVPGTGPTPAAASVGAWSVFDNIKLGDVKHMLSSGLLADIARAFTSGGAGQAGQAGQASGPRM